MSVSVLDHLKRRDFLTFLSSSMLGVGAIAVAWPFIDSLNPAAGTEEKTFVYLDISKLSEGHEIRSFWLYRPILVMRRTAVQIADLSHHNGLFNDQHNHNSADPVYTLNSFRSIERDIMIAFGYCTYDFAVLRLYMGHTDRDKSICFYCPQCGSEFDSAGHSLYGPATELLIPPHHFQDQNQLIVGQDSLVDRHSA